MTTTKNLDLNKMIQALQEQIFILRKDDLAEIRSAQAVQTEQIKNILNLVERMSKTLYGNSHAGLTTVVSNLERELKQDRIIKETIIIVGITIIINGLAYLLLAHGQDILR